jgi:aminoglycoside phosphotransferase (APT) family kinase protein
MEGRGDPATHAGLLAMLYPGFVERYAQRLGREVMGVAERLMAVAGPYLTQRPGPQALVHGDFRPDNLLVGDGAVWVVDWQTVAFGAAFGDLAYFLGGALDDADRSEHAAELLERYRARLAFHGVELSTAEVAEGWRRYALDGLVMAIGASQVVGRTDRGDDMFCAMAERSATHALVVGTLDLFD